MRWLRWLTYSHDPELHAKLDALTARLDAAGPRLLAPEAPKLMRLDCGHEDTGFVKDGNGITACRACDQHKWTLVPSKAPLG